MIDRPLLYEPGEGLYEFRWDREKSILDYVTLRKHLATIQPIKNLVDSIVDRLQNFRVVYINVVTLEIMT